jgi:hypothetical protein
MVKIAENPSGEAITESLAKNVSDCGEKYHVVCKRLPKRRLTIGTKIALYPKEILLEERQ